MATELKYNVENAADVINASSAQMSGISEIETLDAATFGQFATEYSNLFSEAATGFRNNVTAVITKINFFDIFYKKSGLNIFDMGVTFDGIEEDISTTLIDAEDDTDSYTLDDMAEDNPFIYHANQLDAQYWVNKSGWRFVWSVSDEEFQYMLLSVENWVSGLNMLNNRITQSIEQKRDQVARLAITNRIAVTLNNDNPNQSINLLELYNDENGTDLLASDALKSPEFLRWATAEIDLVKNKMENFDGDCNIASFQNSTIDPKIVVLKEFANKMRVNLLSDVYNKELLEREYTSEILAWQSATGGRGFDTTSRIMLNLNGVLDIVEDTKIDQSGVLGIIYDSRAVQGSIKDVGEVEQHRTGRLRFTTYYKHQAAKVKQQGKADFVVFYIADPVVAPETIPVDEKTESKPTELEDMTVNELKDIAKLKDIAGYSNMKKAELIEKIKETK